MTYNKPSIKVLATASAAIQGHANKAIPNATDADLNQTALSTGSAYDLDE